MVAPLVGAALISGATSLLGGLFGKKSNDDARKADREAQQKNYEMQKEFAQNGIRWKVEDARAAGIHPLAAMGAPTYQASPVYAGSGPDNSLPNAFTSFGQDISRAVAAGQTSAERQEQRLRLSILSSQARTEAANADVAEIQALHHFNQTLSPAVGAPIPSMAKPGTVPSATGFEKEVIPGLVYQRTSDGHLAMLPSTDAKNRVEDFAPAEYFWSYENIVRPFVVNGKTPPNPSSVGFDPKPGNKWVWEKSSLTWKEVPLPTIGPAPEKVQPDSWKEGW